MTALARSFFILLALGLPALAAHAATLTVVVSDVEKVEGAIMLALYASADDFDAGGAALRGLRVEVDGDEVTATIDDLPAGRYAIKLYHDANDNGEMDVNMMGLPKEKYGFSGNKGRFGPPPFEEAAIDVSDDETNQTVIKLR